MFAQEISHYKIIKKLGAGGMGEVYLAEDARLNRKVALKILPESLAQDRRQLSRFLREASLAANLNHPNISTIYEVGELAETPFIAMEYIEGETLADKIESGTLGLDEIIETAIQIADALDEAHRQGIIHRDIKATNVIINRRSLTKILDFGLAKTIIEDVSDKAVTRAKTEAGMLVGTVRYMSPEQSLGRALDGRTDLWSLGVLLYEMIGGESPFRGATPVAVFDEILHKQPRPLAQINENISAELENIVFKLLEKDREFRYQTASDLRTDLKRLQRNSAELIGHSSENRRSNVKNNFRQATAFVKTQTDEFGAPKTIDHEPIKENKRRWLNLVIIAQLSILLLGGGLAAYKFIYGKSATVPFEKRESQRLTTLGKVADALISADGNYLIYAQDDGELQSLWVKQVATGSTIQLVPPANVVYQGLTVSPDGNWVYYNFWDRQSVGQIFRVPILGGIPQKVIHDCMPGVDVSPNNREIVFIRSYDREETQDLIIADVETRAEKVLSTSAWGDGIYAFAWAPDGQTVTVISGKRSETGDKVNFLSEISVADKSEKIIWQIPSKVRNLNSGLTWKPDKSGLLVSIAETQDEYSQIWQVSYPAAEAVRLTKDFNSYGRLSITADGKTLASVQQEISVGLWILPTDDPARAQKVTSGKMEGMNAAWTPDGKIVYTSTLSGSVDIWTADADGANKKQLTADAFRETHPCVTADGATVAFVSNRNDNNWNLWVMNRDGTNRRQLLAADAQWKVYCSKKENALFYLGVVKDRFGLWKISLAGGEPIFIWSESPFHPSFSPDERQIAYAIWNAEKKRLEQEIYTMATGRTERIELPSSAVGEGNKEPSVKWTADGRYFSVLNEEKTLTNIWLKSIGDGKLKRFTDFNENRIYSYDWSPDGKKLLVLRGVVSTDAVLIKENN